MSGRHPFSELTWEFTPKCHWRVDDMKRELLAAMPLYGLRQAKALIQGDTAKVLKVSQLAMSKLEHRADMYVASLRAYIESAGRTLKIIAEFPKGKVAITNFSDIGEAEGH